MMLRTSGSALDQRVVVRCRWYTLYSSPSEGNKLVKIAAAAIYTSLGPDTNVRKSLCDANNIANY